MRNNCSEKIDSAVIDAVSSEACLVSYRHGKADGWSAETGSLCSGPTLTVVHSLDVGEREGRFVAAGWCIRIHGN